MEKKELQATLSAPFDLQQWQQVLRKVFGVQHLYATPSEIPLPANNKADAAYELGKFTTADDRLVGLYWVKVKPNVWIERNKVGLRELLRSVYKYDVDGALIVFEQGDKWRLSFVSEIRTRDEQGNTVEQLTEPRRYTYLLGAGEKTNTPSARLASLAGKKLYLDDIRQAFSVEVLNAEFYKMVANHFYQLVGTAENKNIAHQGVLLLPSITPNNPQNRKKYQEFAVRLIGRTVFCWFLKVKKSKQGKALIPEELLSAQAVKQHPNYYHNILEKLFFQTLNTPMAKRRDDLPEAFRDIPFLNGGLFDPHPDDYYKLSELTGLSGHLNTLIIPDSWFASFFEQLEQYNFTIDENSSVDVEVSVDPEMLGRIFENLLAEIDPESGETARKATGSYYTPREIVDYMATESLVHYLHSKTHIDPDQLRPIFKMDSSVSFTDDDKEKILQALDQLKIIDPACGSGAFPMGVLQKMVMALEKLDPSAHWWKQQQISRIENVMLRKQVSEKLDNTSMEYARKIGIIQNTLYGVDIQPIAAEISKLRCFLTLVVDENVDDTQPNRGVEPLPNLEFKFVTANALIGLPVEQDFGGLFNANDDLDKLKQIRLSYLQSYGDEKNQLKEEFKSIQTKILRTQYNNRVTDVNSRAYLISTWEPFSHESANWFDPEWMFGVKEFDVVIGNPPYIQLQKAQNDKTKYADLYKAQNYETFARTGDIYCLFYEKGMKLLKSDGILCYITSNKWMRAGYGEKLRAFFTRYNPLLLLDLGPNVFENATVDTNILIIQKCENRNQLKALTINERKKDTIPFDSLVKEKSVVLKNLSKDAWFIGSDAEQRLKEKIERIGKPLKDWDVKIYRGVLTGLNEAFIITTEKRNEILAHCKTDEERRRTEAIIKPILRGKDIKRYYYEWAGLWVIVIPAGWTNENKGKQSAEEFIQEQFPSLMTHLKVFEAKAKKRDDQGDYWWELRACAYYPEFEKEKVVWQRITQEPTFCLVKPNVYVLDSMAFFTGNNLKFIMAILNSKLIYKYVEMIVHQYGFTGFRLSNQYVEVMPLPPITPTNEPIVRQIEALVDKILAAKKEDKNADTTAWEREIDGLVYGLYGLTEEEIKIIEGK
ncbi:type I restriction-modification system DNA methylase subunit [Thermonema lapsum]|uniref:site-specific DNA-methyltransferase (adenine-specific) n=1 Tax=Thermonema lapsum TaxID=28195 RepID=A0A846MR94_9BACT|nr:Eco57I restriction-modification methylase domain-containing protein [Thermonema lapsum]NIK73951.1 type I restriction-modification system DNA methylase subunit [Thermonema lapsum]